MGEEAFVPSLSDSPDEVPDEPFGHFEASEEPLR